MTVTKDIRVILVDDHMLVRKGLVYVLNGPTTGIDVIAEAESGEEAIFLCQKLNPDMIIMDIEMDGIGGLEATRLLAQHYPQIKIVVLSIFDSHNTVSKLLRAGARGFLRKNISSQTLIESIKSIYVGETITPKYYAPPINEEPPKNNSSESNLLVLNMGEKQQKVLALMSKGFTNREIAERINISLHTVRYHVSAIFHKLDVSNRAEAVALAIHTNIINENNFD